jgi:hypothetical protein
LQDEHFQNGLTDDRILFDSGGVDLSANNADVDGNLDIPGNDTVDPMDDPDSNNGNVDATMVVTISGEVSISGRIDDDDDDEGFLSDDDDDDDDIGGDVDDTDDFSGDFVVRTNSILF